MTIGRAAVGSQRQCLPTYDASQEIRTNHLTREEGVALVKEFDGGFPEHYFHEVIAYLEMDPEYFLDLCELARSPHLWAKEDGEWKLKHLVS